MRDFQLRNDTKLLFRDNPVSDLAALCVNRRVLFVYGNGSARDNGCYDDVLAAVSQAGGTLFELTGASRELADVERGLASVSQNEIDLIIGAGGASVMDCSKLIAFGAKHPDGLWDYVKGRKNPYGSSKLPLILMPTYPSSGSENGLGAVCIDSRTGDFGTAFGIPADVALLVPRYALTLDARMTAYTGLVALTQLCTSTLGDKNPLSYGIGIAAIRSVLAATQALRENPADLDARGVILYGAALSTSGRLGLGKEDGFAYEIYELEFIPERLFGVPYRQSLTTIFPRFLAAMAAHHEGEVRALLADAFDLDGDVEKSVAELVTLFESLSVPMCFEGTANPATIDAVDIHTSLAPEEVRALITACCQQVDKMGRNNSL